MYKRIALMALFLFSLSALAEAQEYRSKGHLTRLPLNGAVDNKQQHILDTLSVGISDTLNNPSLAIPNFFPQGEVFDEPIKMPAVVLEKPDTGRFNQGELPIPHHTDPLKLFGRSRTTPNFFTGKEG